MSPALRAASGRPHGTFRTRCVLIALFTVLLCTAQVSAQRATEGRRTLDSIRTLLGGHAAPDTVRVRLLNALALAWSYTSPDSGIAISTRALALARTLRHMPGIALSLRITGTCYWRKDQLARATAAYIQANAIYEALNDSSGIADMLNMLGVVHMNQNDFDGAQKLFARSIGIRRSIGPESALAPMLINSGIMLAKLNRPDEALAAMEQGLVISLRHGITRYVMPAHLEMGRTLTTLRRLQPALAHLVAARRMSEELGDESTRLLIFNALAACQRAMGRPDSALVFAQRALDMSYPLNSVYSRLESYDELALASAARGRYQDAFQFALKHAGIHDTLRNVQDLQRTTEIENEYEFGRISRLREQQQNALLAKQDTELRLRNTLLWGSLGALLLAIITTAIFYRLSASRRQSNVALLAANEEITRQKVAIEDALQQLVITEGELRLASRTKERLYAIIAHDLRGPIGTLMSMTQMMTDPSEDLTGSERETMLGHMHRSLTTTYELLDNLLQWSVEQRGVIRPMPVPVDLPTIIHHTFSLLSMQIAAKDIMLTHSVPEGLTVHADERMLTAVIRNLLSNAIKYSHAGGTIHVSAGTCEGMVGMRIHDSGVGMSQELIERILSGEAVASAAGTAGETGTGLGLHLCREFVTRNNGTFTIRSEIGRGSEFSVCLPAPDASAAPGQTSGTPI